MREKKVSLIHVPFGLGSGCKGTELTPESMLQSGLKRQLGNLGYELAGEYRITCPERQALSTERSKVKYVPETEAMCGFVAEQVAQAVEQASFPLVLGGDHSVTVGVTAGLTSHYSKLGMIWFDAHPSLHTEETTCTGNLNEMSLAAIMGKGGGWRMSEVNGSICIEQWIQKEPRSILS